jgi:cytochrome c-type biogenesis protein CcmE
MDPKEGLEEAARLARSPLPAAFVAAWAAIGLVVAPFVARHRTHLRHALRIAATCAALLAAAVIYARATVAEPEYYKYVDEVLTQRDALLGKRVLVHGCVVAGSLEQASGVVPPRLRFSLRAHGHDDRLRLSDGVLPVTYEGFVPDTFGEGREVIVKGRLAEDGTLVGVSDGLMSKCPAKWDSSVAPPPWVLCPP